MEFGKQKRGLRRWVENASGGFIGRLSWRRRLFLSLSLWSLIQVFHLAFEWSFGPAPFLVLLMISLAFGWFLGLIGGLVSIVFGAVSQVYFFYQPYGVLSLSKLPDPSRVAFYNYLAAALAVNLVLVLFRFAKKQSATREHRLNSLINGSGEGFMLVDKDTNLLFTNRSAQKLLGHQEEKGLTVNQMIHPADQAMAGEKLAHLIKTPDSRRSIEARMQHANGSWRWIEMNATNMLDDPAIKAVVITFHDVTVRKLSELELLASQQRLELAQLSAHIGTFEWNIQTNEMAWSAEMERLYGMQPGQFTGKYEDWIKLVHYDDLPKVEKALNQAIKSDGNFQIDYRAVLPSGRLKWIAAKGTVVADETGKAARMIGVNSDFTDRKRSEESQSFLVQASKLLSASLDYEATLNDVARLASRTIADWCLIDLLDKDKGAIEMVAAAHRDPDKLPIIHTIRQEYPSNIRSKSRVRPVVENGEVVLREKVSENMVREAAEDDRHFQLWRELGFNSLIIVPIKVRGQSIGAITLVAGQSMRKYSRTDVGVAHALAERAAAAIDNARLYRQTRAANVELEQRVAERTDELRRSEEQYRLMFESLQDIYYRTDQDGRVTLISPSVEQNWGYEPEEVIGRMAADFYADPVERSKLLKELDKSGEVKDIEVRLKNKAGEIIYASITSHVWKDWSGQPRGVEGIIRDISERKQAEEQLAREQKFIRELIHSSKDGMFALDLELRYTVWNPGMEVITGKTAHEVLGQVSYELFPEFKDSGAIDDHVRPALEGKASETGITTYQIRDTGMVGYFEGRYSPIYDEKAEVVGVLGIIRDVTERHLAEEKVRESRQALQEAQAIAKIGSWEWDVEKDVITWSDELYRLFEVDPANFQSDYKAYLNRLPEDERGKIDKLISDSRKSGQDFDFEHRIIRRDGSERIIHAHGQVLRDEVGKVVKMRGTSQDITDRKLAEEILKESEERFRLIVDGVQDYGIFMLDAQGRVVSWNSGAEKLNGYKTHEILGKHFSIFYTPESKAANHPQEELERATQDGSYQEEGIRIRKDGSTYMAHVLITALRSPDGSLRGFSKVTRDITEQKKVEQMKGDFVSLVSHQLKTPVALVRGYVDNLLSGLTGELNEKQISYLRDIQDISSKSYNLITDLLNISRIERGVISMDIRPVKLRDIVHLAVRSNQPRMDAKGIKFVVRHSDPEVMVRADKFKTAEAISNILDNAIKFTNQGSITIQSRGKGKRLELTVADTGSGIPEELMDKLFTRDQIFSGSPRPEGGSGLGLYIAKQFMEVQNGDIRVESIPGKGTKFTFILPLAKVGEEAQVMK